MSANAAGAAQHLLVYAKGIVMGVSDSVPGVSGGTIAVAANIYDRVIYALRAVDAEALRLLAAGRAEDCWRRVDGAFLLSLGLGIGSGLLLGANLIVYLIENHPEPLRAFFIGLIAATLWMLRAQAPERGDALAAARPKRLFNLDGTVFNRDNLPMIVGLVFVLLVSLSSPGESQPSAVYLFFCGMIAVGAMLLPGLSGAFILLLLGAYEYMLAALANLDIRLLLIFLAGCVLGVLTMSRIIAWLLCRHHSRAYSFIRGMLLGSIFPLWPWQAARDGGAATQFLANRPVAPIGYLELTGSEPAILICLAALLAGLGATLAARSLNRTPR